MHLLIRLREYFNFLLSCSVCTRMNTHFNYARSPYQHRTYTQQDFTAMECDLACFDSVKQFCRDLDKFRGERPLDRLVCNAAVYQPSLDVPKWTPDGHEQQLQINFLSHFLLISKVLPSMVASVSSPRVILVGSVTGNDNTVGGGGVYPIADLKDLEGMAQGAKQPISMMDGYNFNGAKVPYSLCVAFV